MKVAIIGTGYVGLVTGTCLAELGNAVTCIDIDEQKITALQKGVMPIFEPNLESLLERNLKEQRLSFTSKLKEGIQGAEVIFLALPTPPDADGQADLKHILKVANDLGPLLESYTVIVDKSTVPVGTAEKVRECISKRTSHSFSVVSNPEFLREGFAVNDFMKPDRIVIGSTDERAIKAIENLFKPLVRQGNPIIVMDEKSAELTKYAANAFLATKITFMNEIANFCERVGADVDAVRLGIGSDDRIGKRFLFPGMGYGGSCFPKDIQALHYSGISGGYRFKILEAVMQVNEQQRLALLPKLKTYFNNDLSGKKMAVWGLSFKPDTDDIREAPALYLLRELLSLGVRIKAYDPKAMDNSKVELGDAIEYCESPYDALEMADALIICTEWAVFHKPDFALMKSKMASPAIFDGRNIFDLEEVKALGFDYFSIGR
ncbi:MAG: UDP-glucose/GDP-mannose dehydrogenase family protein [Bacteroidetes bacterium]|nr:UDP-glucose/GDP-mannose dehydrogenase family protein [Bacteroidota bacterium]MBM3425115.1 UDP-glucose/GDP-mannose dehydrogenase family protein [Bacteroidota bacterium]